MRVCGGRHAAQSRGTARRCSTSAPRPTQLALRSKRHPPLMTTQRNASSAEISVSTSRHGSKRFTYRRTRSANLLRHLRRVLCRLSFPGFQPRRSTTFPLFGAGGIPQSNNPHGFFNSRSTNQVLTRCGLDRNPSSMMDYMITPHLAQTWVIDL